VLRYNPLARTACARPTAAGTARKKPTIVAVRGMLRVRSRSGASRHAAGSGSRRRSIDRFRPRPTVHLRRSGPATSRPP